MRRMVLVVSGLALAVAMATGAGVRAEQAQDAAVVDKAMKAVGPAFSAARKAAAAGKMAEAKTSGQALAKAFADTEAFFKSHGKADGVEWSQVARKAADGIAGAATAEAATAAASDLQKTCAGCHAKYRGKAADGAYTYKAGN